MDQITVRISPALRRARSSMCWKLWSSPQTSHQYTIEPTGLWSRQTSGPSAARDTDLQGGPEHVPGRLAGGRCPPLEPAPQERFPHWVWEEEPPRLMLTDGTYVKDPLRASLPRQASTWSPNQFYFSDRKGVLMVRATPRELDIIQKAIEVLNVAPRSSPSRRSSSRRRKSS